MATLAEPSATAFERTLSWRGGFWLAFVVPVSGLLAVGYEIGAIGAYGALAVWLGVGVIALLQNHIFAELAGMFPAKPGGISLYASETWGRYFAPIGGILGAGYWAAWSLSLAAVALVAGNLVQSEWFPHATDSVIFLGDHIGLASLVGGAVLLLVYLINIAGIKFVVDTNLVLGSCVLILACLCFIGPFLIGKIHAGSLTFHAGSGAWSVAAALLTWSFVASNVAYATEIAATFTPEYRNPSSDAFRALRSSALLVLVIVGLSSTIFPAAIGERSIAANPAGFFAPLVSSIVGRTASSLVIAVVCGALVVTLGSITSDSGRALYGMSADGLMPTQLHKLNRANQPARAMTVDLLLNLAVLFFVSNIAGIVYASNFGYLLAVVFSLGGFVLLRKTRPDAHRPLRLGRGWVPVAGCLVLVNGAIIVMGLTHPGLIGYGGSTARIIGLSIIPVGLACYFFTKMVQHGVRGRALWRTGSSASSTDLSLEASPMGPLQRETVSD
jgi:amino acid transporter